MTATGPTIRIDAMSEADVAAVIAVPGGPGWNVSAAYWGDALAAQGDGTLRVALARVDGIVAGYGTLDRFSQHAPFRAAGLPEIKALRTAEAMRGLGIATALLDVLEGWAAEEHRAVGLGVGLSARYGAAQRLYARRGYVPDGRGITWRHQPLQERARVRLDDDLLLWLAKDLSQHRRG